jgi:hypothetical protein
LRPWLRRVISSRIFLWTREWKTAYVVKDAKKWLLHPTKTASEFDAGYYRVMLEEGSDGKQCPYSRDINRLKLEFNIRAFGLIIRIEQQ